MSLVGRATPGKCVRFREVFRGSAQQNASTPRFFSEFFESGGAPSKPGFRRRQKIRTGGVRALQAHQKNNHATQRHKLRTGRIQARVELARNEAILKTTPRRLYTMTKMKTKTPPPKSISGKASIKAYESLRPQLEAYNKKLGDLLAELMNNNKIKVQSLEHRTKSIDSFSEKISRPGKRYSNPIKQMTDLSGHRIIVYYTDDIDKVSEIIQSEFAIDIKASVDKRDELAPNEFGYLSKHYIVSLKEPRASLAEWKAYAGFKVEIQLRSVLQHAWAAIEHSLQYKADTDVPISSRRQLSRLSGLFELADQEFSALRAAQQRLAITTREAFDKGANDIEVNAVTMLEYINQSRLLDEILKMAINAGFTPANEQDARDKDKADKHSISGIVQIAKEGRIGFGDFQSRLRSNKKTIKIFFQEVFKASEIPWIVTKPFALLMACCLIFRELITKEMLGRLGWNLEIAEIVLSAARRSSS
ncbi:GTP pyrophosphokinase [Myxococcus xanthus]|uniref:GTP pyrophosphokinase n=1 Tax=Myxococcus xanthus TaxID=34 RepID=UPI001127F239|nr:hypothetical protein [Myxococcus xanthus]